MTTCNAYCHLVTKLLTVRYAKQYERTAGISDMAYKFEVLKRVFDKAVCFCPADSVLAGDILNAKDQAEAEGKVVNALRIISTLAQVVSSKLHSLGRADRQLKARIKNLQNVLDSDFSLLEVMQNFKNTLLSSKIAIFIINQNCRISENLLKLMEV